MYNTTKTFNISKQARKEIRSWAMRNSKGYSYSAAPIVLEDSSNPPQWLGDSYCYQTKGGKAIRYPSAYAKKGWSNIRYIPSDRRILVGKEWVRKLEIDLIQVSLSKRRKRFVTREMAEFVYNFL